MGKVSVGVNLEFIRHEDKPFEWGVAKAAELGYEYVEPWVHLGRELISEAGYFATISMWEDPIRIAKICEKAGVKISGLSSHTPLCKPDISGNYLKQAIRFASDCGAPVVNTDEGPKPKWTTEDEDFVLIGIGADADIEQHQNQHRPGPQGDEAVGLHAASARVLIQTPLPILKASGVSHAHRGT